MPLCFVRHGCRSPSNGGAAAARALAKWCKFQHMTLLASRLGRLLFRQLRMWSWPARRSGQIKRWLQVAKKPEQKKDVEVEVDWVPFHGISSNCKKEHPSRRKTASSSAVVTPLYEQGQPVEEEEGSFEDEETVVYCLKRNLTTEECLVGLLEEAGMLLDMEAEGELGAETLESSPCNLDRKPSAS